MKIFVVTIACVVGLAMAEPPSYRQQNQQRRYFLARQEDASPAQDSNPADAAPYPPSGWKPDGPSFELPQRQVDQSYGAPVNDGPVSQQYGAPSNTREQREQNSRQRFATTNYRGQSSNFDASQNRYHVEDQPRGQFVPPQVFQARFNPQPDRAYGPPEVTTTTEQPSTTTDISEDATTTVSPDTDSEVEPVNSVNELDEEGELDEQTAPQQRGEYHLAYPDGRLQRIRYVSREDPKAMKLFARIVASNVEPLRGPIFTYAPLQQLRLQAPASSSVNSQFGKLELQEETPVVSPPLAAFVRYAYDTPAPVIPLGQRSTYTGNYVAPIATPDRGYLVTL